MGILQINKLKKSSIFCDDFLTLTSNNIIDFTLRNIVVVYAPNGVGKTSLAKTLNNENGSEIEGTYNGNPELAGENGIFHVIMDQNSRNIIAGKTEDFIMGDGIRQERELKASIDLEFTTLKEVTLNVKLKNEYGISKGSSKLLTYINDNNIKRYATDLAKSTSKGKNINLDDFINYVSGIERTVNEIDQDKFKFIIENTDNTNSIFENLRIIVNQDISHNEHINEVEENGDAISILTKYRRKTNCIVCDNDINPEEVLAVKTENMEEILNSLNENIKAIVVTVLDNLNDFDPFNIKNIILDAIQSGNIFAIRELNEEIDRHFQIYSNEICNLFISALDETQLLVKSTQYQLLLQQQLQISEEDMQFIERFLNDSLEKSIRLMRDENSNEIKLYLNESEFLGVDRSLLHLSTGEQNFISITFELLKAKNLQKEIVVIDDPISSFDSIFKNKIVFAMIKFLENKKQLILTHNTDLLRLLEVQKQGCFNLYIFNNVSGEDNGFIFVGTEEQKKIIYINEMLDYLRSDCSQDIIDKRLFLMALTPFMRGYAQFIGNGPVKNDLTKIMHGYSLEQANLSANYSNLFGNALEFNEDYLVTVNDILAIDLDNLNILNSATFPLLNRVLKHTLTYLYLRLIVEKTFVEKYNINTTRVNLLGDIILRSLPGDINQNRRIFFMSRKTLLNEFNHFEGNMNITQPAIDISDTNLNREKDSILLELQNIRAE